MRNTGYPDLPQESNETAAIVLKDARLYIRRAGSAFLDAADLAEEPYRTQLFQLARACDEALADAYVTLTDITERRWGV